MNILVYVIVLFGPPILLIELGNSPETTEIGKFFTFMLALAYFLFVFKLGVEAQLEKNKIDEKKYNIIDEKDIIVGLIDKFQPSTRWRNEEGYHAELIQYLKRNYPNAKAEHQTGASRPDIVINDIAIEVKGPTDTQALTTLADKIFRYSNHYSKHIIVLFEPCFSESRYNELIKGIRASHPNVEVIRKDSCGKQHELDYSPPSSPVPTSYSAIKPKEVIAKPSASVSLQELKDELAKINKLCDELDETLAHGEITEAKYKELTEKYKAEADSVKNQIAKKKFV